MSAPIVTVIVNGPELQELYEAGNARWVLVHTPGREPWLNLEPAGAWL